jgi:hypothetical protein
VAIFLAAMFLIRIGANTFMAVDLWLRGSPVDAAQIAGIHIVLLAAYLVAIGTLAAVRVAFSVFTPSFVDLSPGGGSFRVRVVLRSLLLRPTNLIAVSAVVFTAGIFGVIGDRPGFIVAGGCTAITVAALGVAVSVRSARTFRNGTDAQILETILLLCLVAVNPEVGSTGGAIGVQVAGTYVRFDSSRQIAPAVGAVGVGVAVIPLVLHLASSLGRRIGAARYIRPITAWYRRFLRLRVWLIVYALVVPILLSQTMPASTKVRAATLFLLFGVTSYAVFILYCENTLRERWRRSLSDLKLVPAVWRSAAMHVVFMAIPLLLSRVFG